LTKETIEVEMCNSGQRQHDYPATYQKYGRRQGYITLTQEWQAMAEVQGPYFLRPGIVNNALALTL